MTEQVSDFISYNNNGYSIIEAKPGLFSPWEYNIEPECVDTSNGIGYIAYFNVYESKIFLDNLLVAHTPPTKKQLADRAKDPMAGLFATTAPLPQLNGISPIRFDSTYWEYNAVNLCINYTGTLMLSKADDNQSIAFKLLFADGQLIEVITVN